jgi:hypothetical protein
MNYPHALYASSVNKRTRINHVPIFVSRAGSSYFRKHPVGLNVTKNFSPALPASKRLFPLTKFFTDSVEPERPKTETIATKSGRYICDSKE